MQAAKIRITSLQQNNSIATYQAMTKVLLNLLEMLKRLNL
jgi:hypothetical protein